MQITGRRWSDVALTGWPAGEGKRANKRAGHASNQASCFFLRPRASCPGPRRALRGPADDDDRWRNLTDYRRPGSSVPEIMLPFFFIMK